jgi:hypothetical protein
MLTRRQFLKVGAASGALLAGAGWLYLRSAPAPAPGLKWLDARGQVIVAALAPVILEGALPKAQPERARSLAEVVAAFDRAVSGLSPAVQDEIRQLFALLGIAAGRFIVAGVRSTWAEATPDEVSAFLRRWRGSRFGLLRAGYQALTQLFQAAWYGNPGSWERIGYPGPPALGERAA